MEGYRGHQLAVLVPLHKDEIRSVEGRALLHGGRGDPEGTALEMGLPAPLPVAPPYVTVIVAPRICAGCTSQW